MEKIYNASHYAVNFMKYAETGINAASLSYHYVPFDSPIQEPAVARESTATMTPCWNLKARVVVPCANSILIPFSPEANCFKNSVGCVCMCVCVCVCV